MGHIGNIKKNSSIIAGIVAILSLGMGFAPYAYAGTTSLSLDIVDSCNVTFPASAPDLDDDASTFTVGITPGAGVVAVTTITVTNTLAGVQPILVNVNGGFGDGGGTHIQPPQITVLATVVSPGTSPDDGTVTMSQGSNLRIIQLIGQDSADILFSVDMNPANFVALPVSGTQTATATFTLDPCASATV